MKPEKPPVIKSPIAYNGDKRPIPASTPLGSNQLSFESGFPVLTATPLKAGGLPPDRLDFNAALNLLSSFTFFMQSGNQFSWNAELDYNPGAFVLGSDEALYFCTQANGATPPNTVKNPTTTTGYWVKVFSKQGVFNNDLIADGSITTAKIANNAINNAKISDVSASKVTGLLPVENGGNGTTTGISQAVQNALNGKQARGDYATNTALNAKAPLPTANAGVGEYYIINWIGPTNDIPPVHNGGTWAGFLVASNYFFNGTYHLIGANYLPENQRKAFYPGGHQFPRQSSTVYVWGFFWRIA